MRQQGFIVMWLSVLLSTGVVFGADEQDGHGKPRLELITPQTVEIGECLPYEIKTVRFRFKNTGNMPAQFGHLIPTCSCVTGRLEKETVPPGEETDVIFELDASKVHDTFKRSMWVEFKNKDDSRILVSVTGEVKPLFSGEPANPIRVLLTSFQTAVTNTYVLRSLKKGYSLGAPKISTNNVLGLSVSMTTNKTDDATEYRVTVVATPKVNEKMSAGVFSIPVERSPNPTNIPPLYFVHQAIVGAELHMIPPKIALFESSRDLVRQIRVRTADLETDPKKLTWSPEIEGVTISAADSPFHQGTRSHQRLTVTITIPADRVKSLLKEEPKTITFNYPNHDPAVVELIPGHRRGR